MLRLDFLSHTNSTALGYLDQPGTHTGQLSEISCQCMSDQLVLATLVHQLFHNRHDVVLEDLKIEWLDQNHVHSLNQAIKQTQ